MPSPTPTRACTSPPSLNADCQPSPGRPASVACAGPRDPPLQSCTCRFELYLLWYVSSLWRLLTFAYIVLRRYFSRPRSDGAAAAMASRAPATANDLPTHRIAHSRCHLPVLHLDRHHVHSSAPPASVQSWRCTTGPEAHNATQCSGLYEHLVRWHSERLDASTFDFTMLIHELTNDRPIGAGSSANAPALSLSRYYCSPPRLVRYLHAVLNLDAQTDYAQHCTFPMVSSSFLIPLITAATNCSSPVSAFLFPIISFYLPRAARASSATERMLALSAHLASTTSTSHTCWQSAAHSTRAPTSPLSSPTARLSSP